MTNLKFVEIDPRGEPVEDPRDRCGEYEPLHQRVVRDQARGTYDSDNVPDNGSRRRHNDDGNNGSLSNDLTDGRAGQDWKGW